MEGEAVKPKWKLPSKWRPWLLSLLGGSALVGYWGWLGGVGVPKADGAASSSGDAAGGAASSGAASYKDGLYEASSLTPWGEMSVQVTVKSGRWVEVRPMKTPDSPPSLYAADFLAAQALAAQSAEIDGITGATYTSNAFRDDLKKIVADSKL